MQHFLFLALRNYWLNMSCSMKADDFGSQLFQLLKFLQYLKKKTKKNSPLFVSNPVYLFFIT